MSEISNLGSPFTEVPSRSKQAVIDLVDPESPIEVSYFDLVQESTRYGNYVRQLGLNPGATLAILGLNSRAYLAAYLGILRAGFVAVPINLKLTPPGVEFVIHDADVKHALIESCYAHLLPDDLPRTDLWSSRIRESSSQPTFEDLNPVAGQMAEILYTSGSTGRAKGVVLSHQSQIAMMMSAAKTGRTPPFQNRRGVIAAPLFHMNALFFGAALLAHGGTIIMLPRFETELFIRAILEYQVQLVTGVPTMIAMMYQNLESTGGKQFHSVETVYIGSSPVTQAIIQQAHELFPDAEVINSYGTTETGGGLFGAHPLGLQRPEISVGHPLPHTDMRLLGDDPNQGVLQVKTSTMMSGYLNLPEITAEKVRDGWIDTGDIFRRDENNFYYYVGRSDDMFVCNGENIFPGELESLIEQFESIVQVCVVPVEDHRRGNIPVAFVVTDKSRAILEQDIKDFVLANAPANMCPRHVKFLEALPLAATSKVDRKKLAEVAQQMVGSHA
jgi:long-chain acyl-CoA synthetase